MIRLGHLGLLLGVLACSQTANAQVREIEARPEAASKVFWSFANCAVKKNAQDAKALLDSMPSNPRGEDDLNSFAQKHRRCLGPGDKLTMDEGLFAGALSGAYFSKKYEDRPLPSFTMAPRVIEAARIAAETDPDRKMRLAMIAFGECVFRNRTTEVRDLFATRPASEEESAMFAKILPVLGQCLPAEEGTQLKFSRINLRSILGHAAYRVDSLRPDAQVSAREAAE